MNFFIFFFFQIYALLANGSNVECKSLYSHQESNCQITCLTASSNGKLFAVGLNTSPQAQTSEHCMMPNHDLKTANNNTPVSCGDINVYKLNNTDDKFTADKIFCLKSHTSPVHDLHFSPQADVLVSVSGQICFWNISYVLNNPLTANTKKRHSSRFSSQRSAEEVDATHVLTRNRNMKAVFRSEMKKSFCKSLSLQASSFDSDGNSDGEVFESEVKQMQQQQQTEESFWQYLTGPEDKAELLSCYKLDGNEAMQLFANHDFSQFYTIDDEGVYYNLNIIQQPSKSPILKEDSPDTVDLGDYSSRSGSEASADTENGNTLYKDMDRRLSLSSSASGRDVVDNYQA